MKYFLSGLIAILFVAGVVFSFFNYSYISPQISASISELVPYGTYDLRSAGLYQSVEVFGAANQELFSNRTLEKSNVFIVPHDAADIPALSGFYKKLSSMLEVGDKTIVVVGPDHFWQLDTPFASTKNRWQTSFGEVEADIPLIKHIAASGGMAIRAEPFEKEHSVSIHVPLIAKYFPSAKVAPIMISPKSFNGQLQNLAEQIYSFDSEVVVLASVDFYHGPDPVRAYSDDIYSLKNLALDGIEDTYLINADSTASLYAAKHYAQISGSPNFNFLARTSTEELAPEPFTTHLYGAFSPLESINAPATIVFSGDVMLDRYVDEVFKRRGADIFSGVNQLTEGADFFVFNHEGTLPDTDRPQDLQSLLFSFRSETLGAFRDTASVPAVAGLANNHSFNFGESVYRQTRKNLKDAGFDIFGSPGGGTPEELMFKKEINGNSVAIYGYNQFGGNREQILELVRQNAKEGQLDIVYTHWGSEYTQVPNNFQKETARKFVDAGADIIIGHHPHIVQPYEKIGDSIVFYSLGNFIFDQYFRESTQHGLALKVTILEDDVKIILQPTSFKESRLKLAENSILDNNALYPDFFGTQVLTINNF